MIKPINTKLGSAMPIIGFLLLAASFLMKHLGVNLIAICFVSGVGCAWVGLGVIGIFVKKLKPESTKKMEIDQKDERNIQIREKSGYVTFLITLFTLMLLEFTFLVLDNALACILTISVMAIHLLSFFIGLQYYDKEL